MIFLNSFGITKGSLVSIIGSGGKTTLMYKLAREAVCLGMKVVSTTTTHIFVPTPEQTGKLILLDQGPNVEECKDTATISLSLRPRVPMSPCPRIKEELHHYHHLTVAQDYAEENKVRGLQPDLICEIHAQNLTDLILVEADGSRQKLFKAPKDEEPVIPICSTHCILIVNLDVIGRPLDEKYVHRSRIVSEITGLSPGEVLTPGAICSVLNNPKTYRSKIPQGVETILFLNGANDLKKRAWAEEIRASVDRRLVHKVIRGDLFSQ